MLGSVIAAIAGAPAVVNMVHGNNDIAIELPDMDDNNVNDPDIVINEDENANNNRNADVINADEGVDVSVDAESSSDDATNRNNNYNDNHAMNTVAGSGAAATTIPIVKYILADKLEDKNVEKITLMGNENKNTIDTSWYSKTYNEFHIKTVAQLAGLAELVNQGNTFLSNIIYLDDNLDLNGIKWTPIGEDTYLNKNKYFSGIFDGQGHIINNLTLFESKSYCNSLFGNIYNGTVKNIGIINAKSEKTNNKIYGYLGILASYVENSFIFNVYTTGSIVDKSNNTYYIGGIIGKCHGSTKVIGCYSSVNINSDCLNADGCTAIGGLIGSWEKAKADDIISDCFFNGSIHCKDNCYIGGILGIESSLDAYEVKINNCFISTTDINCASIDNIAWITTTKSCDVTNCYWPDNKDTNAKNQPNVVNYFERDWLNIINKIEKNINQSTYGYAIKDFKDPAEQEKLVEILNKNANPSVRWHYNPDIYFTFSQLLANYTAVDSAINRANSFHKKDYKNFDEVEKAIAKVDRGKHIIYQDAVNDMAKDINDAIEKLECKYANYSEVD